MKKLLVSMGFLCSLISASSAPSFTNKVELVCGTTKDVATTLSSQYAEVPVLIGSDGDEAVVLWYNKETSSFTVIRSLGKNSCVLTSGENMKVFPAKKDDNSNVGAKL